MSLPGFSEMLVVLLIALIVLGPERLGTTARQAGRYYKQFRDVTSGVQTEMRDLFEEATRDEADVAKPPARPDSPSPEAQAQDVTGVPDSTVDTDATVAGSAPKASPIDPVAVIDAEPAPESDVTDSSKPVVDPDVVRE